jgi:hypothetical protein
MPKCVRSCLASWMIGPYWFLMVPTGPLYRLALLTHRHGARPAAPGPMPRTPTGPNGPARSNTRTPTTPTHAQTHRPTHPANQTNTHTTPTPPPPHPQPNTRTPPTRPGRPPPPAQAWRFEPCAMTAAGARSLVVIDDGDDDDDDDGARLQVEQGAPPSAPSTIPSLARRMRSSNVELWLCGSVAPSQSSQHFLSGNKKLSNLRP